MRVTKEQAAKNRERILTAASRLIREQGISGTSVDALTEAAGMTHGSLYSQFGSKERLVEEALDYGIADIAQRMHGAATLGDYDLARSGAKAVISYKSTLLSVTIASMGTSWGCG